MRISRVMLSFFSVGFLAGTFEQAAGLGYAGHGQGASPLAASYVVASVYQPPAAADAPAVAVAAAPATLPEPAPRGLSRRPLIEMGDASAAEAVAAFSGDDGAAPPDRAVRPSSQPASLPAAPGKAAVAMLPQAADPEPAPSKLRPFFKPLPAPDEVPPAPEPWTVEQPREFILPFDKGRVTSLFNQGRRHPAIDLAGPLGTPVYATTYRQRVTFAGWRGGYGRLVITRDPQGRRHYYAHLHRITVGIGTVLEQGETLGLLGSTGRSTGPHVHYEVRTRAGRRLDPSKLLFPDRRVRRGYAWHTPRPAGRRLAASPGRGRPR